MQEGGERERSGREREIRFWVVLEANGVHGIYRGSGELVKK